MTMYAGGPGGDPSGLLAMAPTQSAQGGLLQAPQTAWSQYPLTSGLLSSMAQNMGGSQGGSNSQLAYQMAGRPQMGPFAPVAVPDAIPGSLDAAGSSSGSGSGLVTGLLGTLAKNPKAVSQAYGLLTGAPSLASFGSGAAANGALAAAGIGTNAGIAGATAADSASIAAGNSAWLAAQPAASAGGAAAGTGATAAGTGAASGGSGAAAGSLAGGAAGLGILAAPVIAGMMTPAVSLDRAYWQKMNDDLNSTDANTASGAMYELLANAPNGQVPPEMQARVSALQGGLLKQMFAADPKYQGHQQINHTAGTQSQ